jgi:hypothetical protein
VSVSRPGAATGLYFGACVVFAALTLLIGGLRFPSFTVFVLFLTGGALSWTLDVLIRYASDTRLIAESSLAQARAQHRPLLVLATVPREYDIAAIGEQAEEGRVLGGELEGKLTVENIGAGPAFDVWIETEGKIGGHQPYRFYLPHLNAGGHFVVGLSVDRFSEAEKGTESQVFIRYRAAGGDFSSRYTLVSRRRAPASDAVVLFERPYVAVSKLDVSS